MCTLDTLITACLCVKTLWSKSHRQNLIPIPEVPKMLGKGLGIILTGYHICIKLPSYNPGVNPIDMIIT